VLFDRDHLATAASLQRPGAIIFIVQKILQRSQQERAKPALLLVGARSMRFAQADVQKNPGPGPVRQRMKNRGGEENCKAAANKLRKIRRALAEDSVESSSRAQHDRPMRRLKRSTTSCSVPDRFRSRRVAE
jgi:hypothetical protein